MQETKRPAYQSSHHNVISPFAFLGGMAELSSRNHFSIWTSMIYNMVLRDSILGPLGIPLQYTSMEQSIPMDAWETCLKGNRC